MLFSSTICSCAPILCSMVKERGSHFHIEHQRFSVFAYLFTHTLWNVLRETPFPDSQTFTLQTHGRYLYAKNQTSTCSSSCSMLLYPKGLDISQAFCMACYVTSH